ncbi:hypothetical protein I3A51_04525 [Salmonella enterica]|nr:hypothetical protein [Salmonella enterica]MBH0648106.1 hypothetical protein [Salmonella enterica]
MQTLRDEFIAEVTKLTTEAMGVYVILLLGTGHHTEIANDYPDAPIQIGTGHPDLPGARSVKNYIPTHKEIHTKLTGNRELIFELFLSQLVQKWFDFLNRIYEKALNENLVNNGTYPIPIAKARIDLSANPLDFILDIKTSACREFDFLNSKEKMKTIINILGAKQRISHSDKLILNENIAIRNIFQHAGGIVDKKSLDDLGIQSLQSDEGRKIINIKAGDQAIRTAYDIEIFTNTLINIAKSLIL